MPGPVFGRQDILHRLAAQRREIGEGRIGQQQVFRVFQDGIVLCQVEVVGRDAGQDLLGLLHLVGNDHKLHVRIDALHLLHAVFPVFFPQKQLGEIHIIGTAQMKDAQMVPGKLPAVIFRFYFQPLPDFVPVRIKIIFRLHVPHQQGIIRHGKHPRIRPGNIAAVGHVVAGSARIQPFLPLLIYVRKIFFPGGLSQVQVHKIQAAPAVDVVGQSLPAQDGKGQSFLFGDAAGGDIAKQLIAKPLSFG